MRTIWYVLLVIIVIGAVGWFLSMRSSKSNHTNSVPTAERAIGLPAPTPEGTEAPPGPAAGSQVTPLRRDPVNQPGPWVPDSRWKDLMLDEGMGRVIDLRSAAPCQAALKRAISSSSR